MIRKTRISGIQCQKKEEKGSANRKKNYYNEFATNLMIWANSESTPIGEKKSFYNKVKRACFKKTKTGIIEISKNDYSEKEYSYAEVIDRKRGSFGRIDRRITSDTARGSNSDVSLDGERRNADESNIRTSGTFEKGKESEYTSDSAGSGGYNRRILSSEQSECDNACNKIKPSRQLQNYDQENISFNN